MKKFTQDVQTAEENTIGDLDDIDDPKSLLDEIFGPKPSLTHDNEDKVTEKELSSDNIAPNKPVNLVSESPSSKVNFDKPFKQIESKLIPTSTKQSSISKGLVRENSGNDNTQLQEISSSDEEDRKPKSQIISTTKTDGPKVVAEYCYGKNIPLHPNADIIYCKIVAKGEESFVKLRPNQTITRRFEIKIDPNYKPFHGLLRIPFPLAKDNKTALMSSQLCSVSVPTGNQSMSASSKSQSCSTAGKNVQGPSTSFATPKKPTVKNVTMKQGESFSGKISETIILKDEKLSSKKSGCSSSDTITLKDERSDSPKEATVPSVSRETTNDSVALKNESSESSKNPNAASEPKPVVEYCYGKNIPLHPNADIIYCKIVAKGEESFVKLCPNQTITRRFEIKIDPNYKPFHGLLRIPFPLAKDNKTALMSSQLCSVSVPGSQSSSSSSARSQSCSTSGKNVQGPSTSFAIPEKSDVKNVTMKQGSSFSGRTYGKSRVRLFQSTSDPKAFPVPSTTMGITKAITTAKNTVSSSGAKKILKRSQSIVNKSNLAAVSEHIRINKNVYRHIKTVPQSLLPEKNQTNRDVTAFKVPKSAQKSGSVMKPPNAPAPKTKKPTSAMKGSTLFILPSSSVDQRILPTTSVSGHVERKISATKLKPCPIILQDNAKTANQIPAGSAPMSSEPSQSQAPEIVPVPSLSIVQGESSQTTGEQVVLLD